MRIGELARQTGLAASAIRYYEDRDMFSPGQITRSSNGYRDYGPGAQRRLELILSGRAVGLSLDQMRTQMEHWDTMTNSERVVLLEQQYAVLHERISELTHRRDALSTVLAQLRCPD
ncbi:MerR family transcriptional regulator [Arthrobacter rhombi]|uniref:MerR family transcriptional regulator n=1 Tax=Arthrobacter rhombi TaxID=71253 RepID=UPI003FD27C4C